VILSARARRQANEAIRWWRANRPEAPRLIDDEMAKAFLQIAEQPESGTSVRGRVRSAARSARRSSPEAGARTSLAIPVDADRPNACAVIEHGAATGARCTGARVQPSTMAARTQLKGVRQHPSGVIRGRAGFTFPTSPRRVVAGLRCRRTVLVGSLRIRVGHRLERRSLQIEHLWVVGGIRRAHALQELRDQVQRVQIRGGGTHVISLAVVGRL